MEELYLRIEDYLDNVLSESERAAFEADVQNDPALAAALAATREARERLARQWAQEGAEAQLRDTLKELGKRHFGRGEQTGRTARRISIGRWWMAAAAAAVALLIWLAWPPGAEALYGRYRTFPEASFALKSGEPGADSRTLDEAAAAFNNKDFSQALSLLQAYLQNNPNDLEARFFAGLCQAELNQLADAENTFRQMAEGKNAWSDEANWFLALVYLRGHKTDACRKVLEQITPASAHYAEAQKLLKKMRFL